MEGDKAPLSRGWAYGGADGSRKEEVAAPVEGDKAPLSRGWAYGGAGGSRNKEVAALLKGGKAPLSRGWAYGGTAGSCKEVVEPAAAPEEGDEVPLSRAQHMSSSSNSSNVWAWDLETFLMIFYSALNIFFIITYTKAALSKGLQSYYGRWKLLIHFLGASLALMSGSISLFLFKSFDGGGEGKYKYAEGFAVVMAAAVLLMAGVGSIAMARYTQGDEGTNLAGYVM